MKRLWKTKAGVLVVEVARMKALRRGQQKETKICALRHPSLGFHGWLWLKNLAPVLPKEK